MDGGGPAGGGKGQPSAPPARLTRCDPQGIVSELPMNGRLVGLIPLLMGMVPLSLGVASLSSSGNGLDGGDVLGIAICLGFSILLFAVAFYALGPTALHIDTEAPRYRLCQFWWPLHREKTGSWDDFSHLSLKMYDNGLQGTTLQLHWQDSRRGAFSLHTTSREEARFLGRKVASLLGLHFSESTIHAHGVYDTPAPDARLVSVDETGFLAERPWGSTRGLGLALALIGLAAFGIILVVSQSLGVAGISIPQIVCFLGAFVLVAGGYRLMGPLILTVNARRRTFCLGRGWQPFCQVEQGQVDEFDRLALWPYDGGKKGMALLLHWRDGARPPFVLHKASLPLP
jgi:hypothetical protein